MKSTGRRKTFEPLNLNCYGPRVWYLYVLVGACDIAEREITWFDSEPDDVYKKTKLFEKETLYKYI